MDIHKRYLPFLSQVDRPLLSATDWNLSIGSDNDNTDNYDHNDQHVLREKQQGGWRAVRVSGQHRAENKLQNISVGIRYAREYAVKHTDVINV